MHYLLVTLYEFGQFLHIVLWIAIPMAVLSVLITTYLHYHKRRKDRGQSSEVPLAVSQIIQEGEIIVREGENAYHGLLWMKNKYEQDREQAALKYEQLKQELRVSREKYNELQGMYVYTRELLMKIYKELEQAIETEKAASPPAAGAATVTPPEPPVAGPRIVGWMESTSSPEPRWEPAV
jgi:hypothetical protein